MSASLDNVVSLLQDIKNNLNNNGNGSNSNSFTPSFHSDNNSKENKKRYEYEIKQEELLTDRQNGRYYSAYEKEKELFELSQKAHKERIKQLNKERQKEYKKITSIRTLKKKLEEARANGEKKKEEDIIQEISLLQKINDIKHQANLDQMRFNRSMQGKNGFTELSKSIDAFSDKIVKVYSSIKKFSEPWAKADQAASKFTKTIGMAKAGMESLRDQSLKNVASGFGLKYNISSEELIQAQSNYIKGIGRNINMSNEAQENMAAIRAVAGEGGINLASQFENFGVNMEGTGKHIHKMFTEASKQGLSFEKYSENVSKNIRIAQNYTFRDGLKGLENMAKKATAIKLDMQQVASFADKVSTVEGSIETAAKLQVLGGPFASMADPMGMLNESLNDMEAFQDRISKIYGQMGHFDRRTGEVTVSSFNKQRLKAYAEATGQDYSSIMESVHTSAKREEILKQLSNSRNAGFDEDMRELIANTATFKDGKAGVSINGKFKTLDELKSGDKEVLEKLAQDQSKDIKDIAMNLRSLVDMREGIIKQRDGLLGQWMGFLGNWEKSIIGGIGSTITTALAGGAVLKYGGDLFRNVSDFGGIGGLSKGTGKKSKLFNSSKKILNKLGKTGPKGGLGKIAAGISKFAPLLATNPALSIGAGVLGAAGIATAAVFAGRAIAKRKRKEVLDKKLEDLGLSRNGDYEAEALKRINKALATGEISRNLRQKLIDRGDIDILNEIDKIKGTNTNIRNSETNGSVKAKHSFSIQNASIEIKNATFAQIPTIKPAGNTNVTVNGGKSLNGKGSEEVKVNKNINNTTETTQNNNNNKITLDLNINGNLKLVGERGQSIDMIDYFRKNPQQLKGVAEMLEKAIIENGTGVITNKQNTPSK